MKALMDIIVTVILLVGWVKIGQSALHEVRKEALMKLKQGLPSLEDFTRKLTQQKSGF